MKKNTPELSVEDLYSQYCALRDVRPSSDLEPVLRAANNALSAHPVSEAVDLHPEQLPESTQEFSAEGEQEFEDVAQLYREWKSTRVLPDQLAEIRERIVAQTLTVAGAQLQAQSTAIHETKPGQEKASQKNFPARVVEFFQRAMSNIAVAPAAIAASVFALVVVLAPVDNQTESDTSRLAGVSVLDGGQLIQSGDLTQWMHSGIDSNFGFNKSTNRQSRAFGLGVGSMDLVMALRSGSAERTLEISRYLVNLAQSDGLETVKKSASSVFDTVTSHKEVSRSVFAQSMHLLTDMKETFVFENEQTVFELGQWVEVVYLLSSNSIETGDTTSLHQVLNSAKRYFATGVTLEGFSEPVSSSLATLSNINVDDGVAMAEARLAQNHSLRIKSLVE